jgi:methyl-accepting chemotaxis protein
MHQYAAAATTLSHQAQQLMALVSQFRMDDKPE